MYINLLIGMVSQSRGVNVVLCKCCSVITHNSVIMHKSGISSNYVLCIKPTNTRLMHSTKLLDMPDLLCPRRMKLYACACVHLTSRLHCIEARLRARCASVPWGLRMSLACLALLKMHKLRDFLPFYWPGMPGYWIIII